MPLVLTIITTSIISLCSLLVVFTIYTRQEKVQKMLGLLVAFAAGNLIGSAFLHLIPEAYSVLSGEKINLVVILAFVFFFLIEKIFHWHHHHVVVDENHTVGYLNLFTDSFHNFMDGLVIAAAFNVSIDLGIATALAVVLHEIPQEIGDFSILLHSGFSFTQALRANFFVALTAVAGGIVGHYLYGFFEVLIPYIMSFAAGGFIYISATDLIPDLKQEQDISKSWRSVIMFLSGIGIMYIFSL